MHQASMPQGFAALIHTRVAKNRKTQNSLSDLTHDEFASPENNRSLLPRPVPRSRAASRPSSITPTPFQHQELCILRSSAQRGLPLPNSISIILPVKNAEMMIVDQVEQLLDMLPDFATDFEILIIDDGSDDLTAEIALELARAFPQIRMISRSQSQGLAAAIEMGMARTNGEFVFVGEINATISANQLRRLWELRHDQSLVLAKALAEPKPIADRLMSRLVAWGDALKKNNATLQADDSRQVAEALVSLQMIRRSAIESLTQVAQPENQISVERDHLTSTVRMIDRPTMAPRASGQTHAAPIMMPLAPR